MVFVSWGKYKSLHNKDLIRMEAGGFEPPSRCFYKSLYRLDLSSKPFLYKSLTIPMFNQI